MKILTEKYVKKITKFSVFVRVTHLIYYTDFGVFCQQKRLSLFSHTFHQKRSAKALLGLFDLEYFFELRTCPLVQIENTEPGKQSRDDAGNP